LALDTTWADKRYFVPTEAGKYRVYASFEAFGDKIETTYEFSVL